MRPASASDETSGPSITAAANPAGLTGAFAASATSRAVRCWPPPGPCARTRAEDPERRDDAPPRRAATRGAAPSCVRSAEEARDEAAIARGRDEPRDESAAEAEERARRGRASRGRASRRRCCEEAPLSAVGEKAPPADLRWAGSEEDLYPGTQCTPFLPRRSRRSRFTRRVLRPDDLWSTPCTQLQPPRASLLSSHSRPDPPVVVRAVCVRARASRDGRARRVDRGGARGAGGAVPRRRPRRDARRRLLCARDDGLPGRHPAHPGRRDVAVRPRDADARAGQRLPERAPHRPPERRARPRRREAGARPASPPRGDARRRRRRARRSRARAPVRDGVRDAHRAQPPCRRLRLLPHARRARRRGARAAVHQARAVLPLLPRRLFREMVAPPPRRRRAGRARTRTRAPLGVRGGEPREGRRGRVPGVPRTRGRGRRPTSVLARGRDRSRRRRGG